MMSTAPATFYWLNLVIEICTTNPTRTVSPNRISSDADPRHNNHLDVALACLHTLRALGRDYTIHDPGMHLQF